MVLDMNRRPLTYVEMVKLDMIAQMQEKQRKQNSGMLKGNDAGESWLAFQDYNDYLQKMFSSLQARKKIPKKVRTNHKTSNSCDQDIAQTFSNNCIVQSRTELERSKKAIGNLNKTISNLEQRLVASNWEYNETMKKLDASVLVLHHLQQQCSKSEQCEAELKQEIRELKAKIIQMEKGQHELQILEDKKNSPDLLEMVSATSYTFPSSWTPKHQRIKPKENSQTPLDEEISMLSKKIESFLDVLGADDSPAPRSPVHKSKRRVQMNRGRLLDDNEIAEQIQREIQEQEKEIEEREIQLKIASLLKQESMPVLQGTKNRKKSLSEAVQNQNSSKNASLSEAVQNPKNAASIKEQRQTSQSIQSTQLQMSTLPKLPPPLKLSTIQSQVSKPVIEVHPPPLPPPSPRTPLLPPPSPRAMTPEAEPGSGTFLEEIRRVRADSAVRLAAILKAQEEQEEFRKKSPMDTMLDVIKKLNPISDKRINAIEAAENARKEQRLLNRAVIDQLLQQRKSNLNKTGGFQYLEDLRRRKDEEFFQSLANVTFFAPHHCTNKT